MFIKKFMLTLWREQGVQAKITFGLLTIALLVVIVGGLGIWSEYRIASLSQGIGEHSAPALLSAEQMKSQTLRLQQEVLSYTLLRSDAPLSNKVMQDMIEIINNYNNAKAGFLEALETHRRIWENADHPTAPTDHEQIETAFKRYWALATALINEVRPKDIPAFKTMFNEAEDDLLYHIDTIILHESEQIIEAQTALTELTSNIIYLNISVIVTALVLALFIAYHTSRTIVEPILDLEAAAIRLGRGNFLSEGKPLEALRSKDEIGVLARAFSDMSDSLQRLNSDLSHNANHDVLTGLANRKYLLEILDSHLQLTKTQAQKSALLFLDFDRFKTVNDYYGHQIGDGLLAAISKRLQETVRSHDLVARLGGDEFTVLLTDVTSNAQVEKMAARLLQAFRQPFQVDDIELRMTASIGIVFINDSFGTAADILRDADMAMYQAKAKGAGRYEIFTESLRQETFSELALEADLRNALEAGSLEVHYQPIIALDSGKL